MEINVCLTYTKEKQDTVVEAPAIKTPKTGAGVYHSLIVQQAKSS